jgi:hypothetical protein
LRSEPETKTRKVPPVPQYSAAHENSPPQTSSSDEAAAYLMPVLRYSISQSSSMQAVTACPSQTA